MANSILNTEGVAADLFEQERQRKEAEDWKNLIKGFSSFRMSPRYADGRHFGCIQGHYHRRKEKGSVDVGFQKWSEKLHLRIGIPLTASFGLLVM